MSPVDEASALNHLQRRMHLEEMSSTPLDVLVVGGGVTGAGAALDAASRGLRVGLVEQRDYASGTSSRSSKMFHGGLRYLERLDVGLVREALRERNLMVNRLCPHLVKPVSFIYPLEHRIWERVYVGTGILLYEILARLASNPLPWHTHLGREGLARLSPALDARGGIRYWDTIVDDARHTLTLARTAAAHGALLANSARVVGFDTDHDGIKAARVLDLETGQVTTVGTKAVINATGVWTDDVEGLAGEQGLDVHSSKGIHLLLPRDRIDSETGMIMRTESSVLFVIPWGSHWIVGTTDTPWSLRRAHPAASRTDIEYLLTRLNATLTTPVSVGDVVGVYAGLRPLLRGESEQTSKLSREHAVRDRGNGLISVAGGKYTTYRVMASDAVDAVAPYIDRSIDESATSDIPLLGAAPADDDRLHGRYGTLTDDLAKLFAVDPEYSRTVVADAPYLMAEIRYAVTHEGALHLDDVLTRRTRLSIETRDRGVDAARPTVRVMADVMGWDQTKVVRELAHYEARVNAERDSQAQPDDRTADAARMGASDVRTGIAE